MRETPMQRMLRLSRENAFFGSFIIQERGKGRKEFEKWIFEQEAHEWLL